MHDDSDFNELLQFIIINTTDLMSDISFSISKRKCEDLDKYENYLQILTSDLCFYRSINFLSNHRLLHSRRLSLALSPIYQGSNLSRNISYQWLNDTHTFIDDYKVGKEDVHDNMQMGQYFQIDEMQEVW
jgi:hypothetical protein